MIKNRNTIPPDCRKKSEFTERLREASSTPRTVTIGDTTVRLSFSDSGSLSTRLASAFNSMLR